MTKTPKFTLRTLTADDLPALRRAYDATMAPGGGEWPDDWHWYCWVGAFDGETLAGFGQYHVEPPVLTFTETGVLPEYRSYGLHLRGMLFVMQHGAEAGCTVARTKCNARNLPSMRNIVKAGYLPVESTDFCGQTFVHWERKLAP